MKLELGSECGGTSDRSQTKQKCHSNSTVINSSKMDENKPRGPSPVIKNGFSGSIFQRTSTKKSETKNSESVKTNSDHTSNNHFKSENVSSGNDASKASNSEIIIRKRSESKSTCAQDSDISIDQNYLKESSSRYSSFSYLNLLPADGSFPHRTQPIGDASNKSRRNSEASISDTKLLAEFSNVTNKSNFMVRNNPIGLAEPSNKKDGYAVGRDGSLYRSSENLYVTSISRDCTKERSSSVVCSKEQGRWKERRSSWSTTVSASIGLGRGLIETGKPAKSIFMPFGSTKGVIKSYLQKHMGSNKNDQGSLTSILGVGSTHKQKKEETLDIQNGIKEIQSLTESCSSSNHVVATSIPPKPSLRKSRKSDFEEKKLIKDQKEESSSSNSKIGMAFKELDVSLKSIPCKDDVQNITLFSNRRRTLSLTKLSQTTNLSEENVTISLPGSRRTSRHPSIERHSKRNGSSLEIFHGSYEVVVGGNKNEPVQVKELSTDVISIKGHYSNCESAYDQHKKEKINCSKNSTECISNTLHNQSICDTKKSNEVVNTNFDTSKTMVQQSTDLFKDNTNAECTNLEENNPNMKKNSSIKNISQSSQNNIKMDIVNGSPQTLSEQSSLIKNKEKPIENISEGVGHALKGLDKALEVLAKERNAASYNHFNGSKVAQVRKQSTNICRKGPDSVLNVTVSLPASRRGSRCPSSDRNGAPSRSRRNSMDLYTAEYKMKLHKDGSNTLEQKSVCHIKVDENNKDDLNLCKRCHNMNHTTPECTEFGTLKCPRCLMWDHWEDTCPTALISSECSICDVCGSEGHVSKVHSAQEFPQRRCIVDMLGWESFKDWFYEVDFRSWWQLNGFVGVPLYKIYKRTTEWRLEPKIEKNETFQTRQNDSSTKSKGGYVLSRDDSIDELMKSVYAPRRKVEINSNEDDDSGRSTPDYLKKYPGSEKSKDDTSDYDASVEPIRKRRTFSETLSMLDEDILAELNIN